MQSATNSNEIIEEGLEKLRELVTAIDTCLFCTNLKTNDGATCRPMSAQQVDGEGTIWFFSEANSDKNHEIEQDHKVQLFFAHPDKGSYLVVNGEATILTDKAKVNELWEPTLEEWFSEGIDDPLLTLIKVETVSAYYWNIEKNTMINFFEPNISKEKSDSSTETNQGDIIL